MMRATSLEEWKDAMRMRGRPNSSFTYADADGNIFYLWNASLPSLPHAASGDSMPIPVKRTSDAWTHYVPFDSLPQFLNPPWGYVHNENDPPYYTNMVAPLDPTRYPPYYPPPRLGFRSQHAISLGARDRGVFSIIDRLDEAGLDQAALQEIAAPMSDRQMHHVGHDIDARHQPARKTEATRHRVVMHLVFGLFRGVEGGHAVGVEPVGHA